MKVLIIICYIKFILLENTVSTTLDLAAQGEPDYWREKFENQIARKARYLKDSLDAYPKNAVIFIGDGMGPTTVTGARIYKGQQGNGQNDQQPLSFEQFSHAGILKTYCLDMHVTDSAAAATAMFCGTKANAHTLGVSGKVAREDCAAVTEAEKVKSLAEKAKAAGKSVGIVTTTTITHGTPGALYAHTAFRWLESDLLKKLGKPAPYDPSCVDIAKQLVENFPGNDIDVIMGGGAIKFTGTDFEHKNFPNRTGERVDGRNLVTEWQNKDERRTVVWNKQELLELDVNKVHQVLGLFAPYHMDYVTDLPVDTSQPSLKEMTGVALKILQKNPNGFFLMVEGGRIDQALHENHVKKAFVELLEMDNAVQYVMDNTDDTETLLVVTADHSHSMAMPGYFARNVSVLGKQIPSAEDEFVDNLPNTMFAFINGPSAERHSNATHEWKRQNLTNVDTESATFQQPAFMAAVRGTHGGEDVGLWANGPGASLFSGTIDNTYIAYAVAHLLRLEEFKFTSTSQTPPANGEQDVLKRESDEWSKTDYLLFLVLIGSIMTTILLFITLFYLVTRMNRKTDNGNGIDFQQMT